MLQYSSASVSQLTFGAVIQRSGIEVPTWPRLKRRLSLTRAVNRLRLLRGLDLNQRPLGYESPEALPGYPSDFAKSDQKDEQLLVLC